MAMTIMVSVTTTNKRTCIKCGKKIPKGEKILEIKNTGKYPCSLGMGCAKELVNGTN